MLWPSDRTCRGGWGSSIACADDVRLDGGWGISDPMGRTLERIWIPGQQARVVVSLGRLLRILIDYLSWDTLQRARFLLGGLSLDTRLGLSVDEGWHRGEFRVIGIVDGFDPMLFLELIDRQRGAS